MAHGTRIDGANKAVTAGFTRIDGVNRKVKKGLTLVGGVQKDINFGGGAVTIEINGTGDSGANFVSIGGTKYYRTATVEVPTGTSITGYTYELVINGASSVVNGSYEYTVNSNISITFDEYTHPILFLLVRRTRIVEK